MKPLIPSLRFLLLAGALGLLATGCAWSLFSARTVGTATSHQRTTTIGRELLDLQEAKEKNAVSDEEYQQLRKAILTSGPLADAAAEK